jgi:hypothetical protein
MLGNASGIDLNNSPLHDLDRIGGLGRVLAQRIIEHRPIRRWDDLKNIKGFDDDLVNDLRGSGAKLGRIDLANIKPRPTTTRRTAQRSRTGPPKKRGQGPLPRNIFTGRTRDRE